jgi:hypothetical protein
MGGFPIKAQRDHAPDGTGTCFRLASNRRIDRADPLRALVTDDEPRILARTLVFSETSGSLDGLRELLDLHFRAVGLKRSPSNESAFIYDEVVCQWAAQGRLESTRANFRGHREKESLIGEPGDGRARLHGVKAVEHATDRLEDRCLKVLNLVPGFVERQIGPDSDWRGTLYPALTNFLLEAARESERIRLVLDAHLMLSFAAGSVLTIKSGRLIELEQRMTGRAVWAPDDERHDPTWRPAVHGRAPRDRGGSSSPRSKAGRADGSLSRSIARIGCCVSPQPKAITSHKTFAAPARSARVAARKSRGPAARQRALTAR